MLVDDDQDILLVASKGLQNEGYNVHEFSDPIAALQHVEDGCKECNVLVTDLRMPHMNGFELIRRIRKIRPHMRLIMMTAFELNMSEFEAVFPSTQIDNVLKKPFRIAELAETIKKIYRENQSETLS
jgi:DNA-binding NtrC family response regulator